MMKTYKEMIAEIENGEIFYSGGVTRNRIDSFEEAKKYAKSIRGNVMALPNERGLLSGYGHVFSSDGDYLYSYVYNPETKEQETKNIYEEVRKEND